MQDNFEAEVIRARNIRLAGERFIRARAAWNYSFSFPSRACLIAAQAEYDAASEALEFAMYSDVRDYL